MDEYLQVSDIIDWQHPTILELASEIASKHQTSEAIAKACFEWVRDKIYHSVDYQMNPVTCCASDVLKYKTGYCYAKSHLLAALMRANNIPTGFCYQQLSINNQGAPYCLHGFNGIYLAKFGWYRVDARGNRKGINAQCIPPQEQLAYKVSLRGEADYQNILTEPLGIIVQTLHNCKTWDEVLANPPDVSSNNLSNVKSSKSDILN